MNDFAFTSDFWSWWVIALTVVNILACWWLIGWTSKPRAGEAATSEARLEALLEEAETAGLEPMIAEGQLALARVRAGAGRHAGALEAAERTIASATSLGAQDLLVEARHLAAVSLAEQGRRDAALAQVIAGLEPLERVRTGLEPEDLVFFVARPTTRAEITKRE